MSPYFNHFMKLSFSTVTFLFFLFYCIAMSFAFPLLHTTVGNESHQDIGTTLDYDESFQDGFQVDGIVRLKENIIPGRQRNITGFTGHASMDFWTGTAEDSFKSSNLAPMLEDIGSGLESTLDEAIHNETVAEPLGQSYQLTTVITPQESEELSSGDFVESSTVYNELNPFYDRKELIPLPLRNLPHDIPVNRIISEVLAENILNDKHFDELRVEELIHELMAQSLGVGEVYSDDFDYDIKERLRDQNKDI